MDLKECANSSFINNIIIASYCVSDFRYIQLIDRFSFQNLVIPVSVLMKILCPVMFSMYMTYIILEVQHFKCSE